MGDPNNTPETPDVDETPPTIQEVIDQDAQDLVDTMVTVTPFLATDHEVLADISSCIGACEDAINVVNEKADDDAS